MTDHDELSAARELRAAVEQLPRKLQPQRDLWPEIASRLERRPTRQTAAGWWRLAAAMLLVAGGLLAALVLRPVSPAGPVVAAEEPGAPRMAAAHLRQRDGVLHAHNDLVEVVARQRARLDVPGAAAMSAGVAELERATADIEAALADHPGDRRLRLALAAAYRRESSWTARFGRV